MPVLAQFQVGQGNAQTGGMQNSQQNPQTIGGTANQNNGRGDQVMFNVPAEKIIEVRADCVCLEYGKPNPKPTIPYKLVPLDSVASDATVAVLEEFGRGEYSQLVAQAAAWHTANNLSWEKLAEIPGELIAIGVHDRYFSKQDLSSTRSWCRPRRSVRPSPRQRPANRPPRPSGRPAKCARSDEPPGFPPSPSVGRCLWKTRPNMFATPVARRFRSRSTPRPRRHQQYVEDCPVCCHPNVLHVEFDEDGHVRISSEAE